MAKTTKKPISRKTTEDRRVLKEIGANIQNVRLQKKLTLLELEVETGIDNSYLSKIEQGDHDIGLVKLVKILKGLKADPRDILTIDLTGGK